MAGNRPDFPFEQALNVARELDRLATFVAVEGGNRSEARAEFLETWLGSYADEFSTNHGAPEDEQGAGAVTDLRSNAEEWATQWALAVNDTNAIVREEAEEDAAELNTARQTAWGEAIRAYYGRLYQALANDWLFYESSPAQPAEVTVDPLPPAVSAPSAGDFTKPGDPFVAYAYDGDARMVASQVGSPP